VATLNQRRNGALFDGRAASNTGTVAASIAKMIIAIDGINCDITKKARAWLANAST
jgi:hypothetical protein